MLKRNYGLPLSNGLLQCPHRRTGSAFASLYILEFAEGPGAGIARVYAMMRSTVSICQLGVSSCR
jgi:hypothetical protein